MLTLRFYSFLDENWTFNIVWKGSSNKVELENRLEIVHCPCPNWDFNGNCHSSKKIAKERKKNQVLFAARFSPS